MYVCVRSHLVTLVKSGLSLMSKSRSLNLLTEHVAMRGHKVLIIRNKLRVFHYKIFCCATWPTSVPVWFWTFHVVRADKEQTKEWKKESECMHFFKRTMPSIFTHTNPSPPGAFPSWLSNLNANVPKSDSTMTQRQNHLTQRWIIYFN